MHKGACTRLNNPLLIQSKILDIILKLQEIGNTVGEEDEQIFSKTNGFALQTRVMLPQNRLETLEDGFLNLNLNAIDHSIKERFRSKLNDAINVVAAFSLHFDNNIKKTAENLYIEEQEKIRSKMTNCPDFEPETKGQTLERLIISNIISLVNCFNEYRNPNAQHGGKFLTFID